MLNKFFLFVILVSVLAINANASQNSPITLTFVTEHSPPYQMLNDAGDVEGFIIEVMRAALATTSYDYKMNIYPWSRSFAMAKNNENTCVFLISRNKHREQLFQWVAQLLTINDHFIGLSNRNALKVNNIEEIKKYNTAVLKEDRTYYKLIELGFIENKNLYVINNTYSLLKLLIKRKNIDFILADTINVKYRAEFNDIDPSQFKTYMKLNDKPTDLHLACSLKTPQKVIHDLAQAVNSIKANGTYAKIKQRWSSQ